MPSRLPSHWCVVCRQAKTLVVGSNIRYAEYEGPYCESCAESIWECPECDRTFNIRNMAVRKSGEVCKPRHYRMTGRIDHRFREIREVCPGWKTEARLRTERYYGWNMDVPSAKTQPRAI